MDRWGVWGLQAVLLAAGIYFFLGFMKTTRGSGIVRGLVVAFAVIALGLWGVAQVFELEELQHILRGSTPYVVMILVILFQPELRRGVARLGEQNKLARLLRGERPEAVSEVSAAMIAMAKRKHGALIAFQRTTPLDAWTQNAVSIQSHVDRRLLQGIFQPGGALHDGAVVIDHDRLIAASCIFPLTESIEVHTSTGTRHRAALGLSEETDALTIAVSEETGEISVCESGAMQRNVDHERLEGLLRNRLGALDPNQRVSDRRSAGVLAKLSSFVGAVLFQDLGRKVAALFLANAWLLLAYNDITIETEAWLSIRGAAPSVEASLSPGTILALMPTDDTHLRTPSPDERIKVLISGPRAEIDRITSLGLGGSYTIEEGFKASELGLAIEDVRFVCGGEQLDVRVRIVWADDRLPVLSLERTASQRIDLSPQHLVVNDEALDPRFEFHLDRTVFRPTAVFVDGPAAQIQLLRNGELHLGFAPITLGPEDRKSRVVRLSLLDELTANGLRLTDEAPAEAELEITATSRDLGQLEIELPLVNLASTAGALPGDWTLPFAAQKSVFGIKTEAVIPTTESPDSQSYLERRATVRRFVEEHLKVFVDISRVDSEGAGTAPVQWFWPPRGWRELLEEEIGPMAEEARVEVLLESDSEVLLIRASEESPAELEKPESSEESN
jgi:diadenylate cyclase